MAERENNGENEEIPQPNVFQTILTTLMLFFIINNFMKMGKGNLPQNITQIEKPKPEPEIITPKVQSYSNIWNSGTQFVYL